MSQHDMQSHKLVNSENKDNNLVEIKELQTHLQSGKRVVKAVDGVTLSIKKGESFDVTFLRAGVILTKEVTKE